LLALGVTNFNFLKLVELDNGRGKMHNILASLLEGVKANKEGVCSDFPLVGTLSLSFVLKVCLLELSAGIEGSGKLVVSFLGLFVLDATEDGLTVDIFAALADDGVADLSDEYYKSSRGVVVGRVGPYH
jgi:hypothetical protein